MYYLIVFLFTILFNFGVSAYSLGTNIPDENSNTINKKLNYYKNNTNLFIEKIISNNKILLGSKNNKEIEEGKIIIILSEFDASEIGLFSIQKKIIKNNSISYIAELKGNLNGILSTNSIAISFDKNKNDQNIHGDIRYLVNSTINSPVKYKYLFYHPASKQIFAAPLFKNENYIDTYGFYAYGINDKLSLFTQIPLYFVGAINLGMKYNIVNNEDIILSFSPIIFWFNDSNSPNIYVATTSIDIHSNNKVITHIQFENVLPSHNTHGEIYLNDYIKFNFPQEPSNSIQSSTEYMFDNFDRVMFGATFDVDNKKLGGFLSYFISWDTLQLSVSILTPDFSNYHFDFYNGYSIVPNLSWRF